MRRPEGGEGGYSVVELVAAVTIFALVFAAVSFGIGRALDVTRNNRNRTTAAYLAASELEEVQVDGLRPGRPRPHGLFLPGPLGHLQRPLALHGDP